MLVHVLYLVLSVRIGVGGRCLFKIPYIKAIRSSAARLWLLSIIRLSTLMSFGSGFSFLDFSQRLQQEPAGRNGGRSSTIE